MDERERSILRKWWMVDLQPYYYQIITRRPISVKFSFNAKWWHGPGIRHRRAIVRANMHDAFDVSDWSGRVYSVYSEVNKLGETQQRSWQSTMVPTDLRV